MPRAAADRLLTVALAALALVAVAVLALAACGLRPHVEMSDSMNPVLAAGDVLWLQETKASDARTGDVVAFRDPDGGRVLVHRVQRVRRAPGGRLEFVTRGDANTGSERWAIPAGGSVGRYTGLRLPALGRLALPAADAGAPLIGLACAAALAAVALRRIWAVPA